MSHLPSSAVFLLCAACCASAGAWTDARSRRIPNRLTAVIFAAGLLLHFASDGWKAMGMSALAGLAGGAIFFIFFLIGGMGAGDVKLMAAVSAVAGFGHLFEIFLAVAIAGGAMAMALAMGRGRLKTTLMNVGALARHHAAYGMLPHPELNVMNERALRLPYGIAIAAGCWIAFLGMLVR